MLAGNTARRGIQLEGRGIQVFNGRGKGDQYIRVIVDVPKNLNQQQKDLLKQFQASLGKSAASDDNEDDDKKGGIFGKKKK